MKSRLFDHIDLRVRNRARAQEFYATILPALGFTHDQSGNEWGAFEAHAKDKPVEFFGFTEDVNHKPNGTRIAFWADTPAEVEELTDIVRRAGGQNLEGPQLWPEYSPGYY